MWQGAFVGIAVVCLVGGCSGSGSGTGTTGSGTGTTGSGTGNTGSGTGNTGSGTGTTGSGTGTTGSGTGTTGSGTGTTGSGTGTTGSGTGAPTIGPASTLFFSSSGFASAGQAVKSVPQNTLFNMQIAGFEGPNVYGQIDASLRKLNDDDSAYQLSYSQGGIVKQSQNVRLDKLSPFDHAGKSTTRTDGTGAPLSVNMGRQSSDSIDQAQLVSIFEGGGFGIIDKVGVFGITTDPMEVQPLNATASYNGDIFLAYKGSPTSGVYGFGTGDVNITTDFNANTITGSALINGGGRSLPSSPFLDDARLAFSGDINTGNEFNGTVTLDSAATGSSMTALDASLNGAFFGKDASTLGGTFTGSASTSDAGNLPLVGGIVAKQ